MIITQTRELESRDLHHFAWNGLRQFKNASFAERRIRQYQDIPNSQSRNVVKQANQIRYCISQAEEYFRAASTVSIATKPLLLYYGAMSLVLAEILIKHDGNSSLDRARGQHAHHGLDLRTVGDPSRFESLGESATRLRAVPLLRGGRERAGTFELWHRTSRESPLSGERVTVLENGASQSTVAIVGTPIDIRPSLLPVDGISLLECFASLPSMSLSLNVNDVPHATARAAIKQTINRSNRTFTSQTIIHPASEDTLRGIYGRFLYAPSDIENLSVVELPSGCIINHSRNFDDPFFGGNLPFGFQHNRNVIHFSGNQDCLNELGLMYVALFILGNYARYFPDQWMIDVENSSPLALVTTDFIAQVEHRLPLLSLSELTQVWFLEKD